MSSIFIQAAELRTIGRSVGVLIALCAAVAHAESLVDWGPKDLVPRSDFILIGKETSPNELQIERVLKGQFSEKRVKIAPLETFPKQFSRFSRASAPPSLDGRCVVFLSNRDGPVRIVANGVYRIRKDGKLLKYRQEMNPGWYQLQQEPAFESLAETISAIETIKKTIPSLQSAKMNAIKRAGVNELSQHLSDLREITSVGDQNVLDFIESQMASDKTRDRWFWYFLQSLPDPRVFPILKLQFDRTKSPELLSIIGRQGSPEAREFLEKVILLDSDEERKSFACYALSLLYETLEKRANRKECEKVQVTVFRLFDENPFATAEVTSHPRILGTIPHTGSIQRLEKVLSETKADQLSRIHETEKAIRDSREKIAKFKEEKPPPE